MFRMAQNVKFMSIRCLEFSKTDTEIYVHIGSVNSEHLAGGGGGEGV